ncbi:MAG: phosphotransferase [Desulfarculaceae bacterium]
MPEAEKERLLAWARRNWPGGDPGQPSWESLPVDGSCRRFARLEAGGRSLVVLSNPGNQAENQAWYYWARHLRSMQAPVAGVVASDLDAGLFLMEDLGSTSLQQAARECRGDRGLLVDLYQPVMELLARLQAKAGEGLDLSVCFDGPELTPEFLLEREAGYFLTEFVQGACGLSRDQLPPGLEADLADISHLAGRAGPRGFVHRDFQSRNLIISQGGLGLVDFQGGRLGPAQYDLASILHDPYVDLCWEVRDRLLEDYIEKRQSQGPFDAGLFRAGWPFVGLSRMMQALGAFAFLTRKRKRDHFAAYISPALATLETLLEGPGLTPFSALRELVRSLPREPGGLDLAPETVRDQS